MVNLFRFIKEFNIINLKENDIERLFKQTIKCAAIFHFRIKILDKKKRRKKQLKESETAFKIYKKVVTAVYKHKYKLLMKSIIYIFNSENYWALEPFCEKIIYFFLHITQRNVGIINELLSIIESNTKDNHTINNAINILKMLSDLTASIDWTITNHDLIIRILKMYIKSLIVDETNLNYSKLKPGLEVAMKRIIRKTSNDNIISIIEYILDILIQSELSDTNLMKIGYLLLLASNEFVIKSIMHNLNVTTLKNILLLISSDNKLKCSLGNQTFQNIIDCNNNMNQLLSPKIFFMEINYNLKVKKSELSEKEFLVTYRKEIHVTFLTAVLNHKDDITIVESLYSSMALLMTEIPCAYCAAFLVCLIMNIQQKFLSDPTIPNESSHRVHAMIISLLSLICWIMEAKVLYVYLNKILKSRAYNAPFLNPPLRVTYHYANHYVLWNKPDFFFEDFEVRYALWKRFRLTENADAIKSFEEFVPVSSQLFNNTTLKTMSTI